jgi:hypothetical protein
VVLKTGLSVSRPFENSGVEWVLEIKSLFPKKIVLLLQFPSS